MAHEGTTQAIVVSLFNLPPEEILSVIHPHQYLYIIQLEEGEKSIFHIDDENYREPGYVNR